MRIKFDVLIRQGNNHYVYHDDYYNPNGFRGFKPDEIWITENLSKKAKEVFMPMLEKMKEDKIHYV